MNRNQHLQEIENQFSVIRDHLRGVVRGDTNGLYLFGPPGVSKSHTVVNFLQDNMVAFERVLGHLSGPALFDAIEENPDEVLVLDDVAGVFKESKAVQILLAALGSPPDGSRVRKVAYRTARGKRVVDFTGSIIAISNLAIGEHRNDVIKAVEDRVDVLKFDPTPEQVEALIYKIATEAPAGVAADDAAMVAELLADECRKHGTRLSVRLFIDKALPKFRLWKAGGLENHWKDLVRAIVAKEFVPKRHAVRDMPPGDQKDADRRIVLAICKEFSDPLERVRAWREWNETARRGSATNAGSSRNPG